MQYTATNGLIGNLEWRHGLNAAREGALCVVSLKLHSAKQVHTIIFTNR